MLLGNEGFKTKPVKSGTVHGYKRFQSYDNAYHLNAKNKKRYWFIDDREKKATKAQWPGRNKPMGIAGNYAGIPNF